MNAALLLRGRAAHKIRGATFTEDGGAGFKKVHETVTLYLGTSPALNAPIVHT